MTPIKINLLKIIENQIFISTNFKYKKKNAHLALLSHDQATTFFLYT